MLTFGLDYRLQYCPIITYLKLYFTFISQFLAPGLQLLFRESPIVYRNAIFPARVAVNLQVSLPTAVISDDNNNKVPAVFMSRVMMFEGSALLHIISTLLLTS